MIRLDVHCGLLIDLLWNQICVWLCTPNYFLLVYEWWIKKIHNASKLQCFHSVFPMASQNFYVGISLSIWDLWICLDFLFWWLIDELSLHIYTHNILHCYRRLLKSGRSLAPVVKPNNLIPPNVATSLSSYMSHNIISAIFSPSSQSLSDRFYITNGENMCPPHKLLISLERAKNKSEVSARSAALLWCRDSLNKTDLHGVN